MLIGPKTVENLADTRERYGSEILKLTAFGESPGSIIMLELSKGLFGAKGEFVTPNAFCRFKSNGKLSRLKKHETIHTAETKELLCTSASPYSMWDFKTEKAGFRIRFIHHQGSRFRIEKDYIRTGSAVLWEVLGKTLEGSFLASEGLGDPEFHRNHIAKKLTEFKEADVLVYDTIRDVNKPNPYLHWSGLQQAFAMLLAGCAVSRDTRTTELLKVYTYLNSVWADVLERFTEELERQGNGLKNSARSINSTSDMFDRLSALWYLRTIIMLNFAQKKAPDMQPASWKASLLTPRAMERTNRNVPELHPMPDLEKMREEVAKHRG